MTAWNVPEPTARLKDSMPQVRSPHARALTRATSAALACLVALTASGCAGHLDDLVPDKDMIGVPIGAVGHLGAGIGISEFSINGGWGGNNDGWGGGGAGVCCVLMPRKITKPITVKVRWTTCDTRAIEYVNDRAVDPNARCVLAEHETIAPVHFAVEPGKSSGLYTHFFPDHHVEVWVSWPTPPSPEYPGPAYPQGPAPASAMLPFPQPRVIAPAK